jgi:hypothetical protein
LVKDIVDGEKYACKCYDKENLEENELTCVRLFPG